MTFVNASDEMLKSNNSLPLSNGMNSDEYLDNGSLQKASSPTDMPSSFDTHSKQVSFLIDEKSGNFKSSNFMTSLQN